MMRTLRDMNMSKFVAEDVPLFLSLIDDLFPGMKAERNAFDDVTAALIKVCARSSNYPWVDDLHISAWCRALMAPRYLRVDAALWPLGWHTALQVMLKTSLTTFVTRRWRRSGACSRTRRG